MPATCQAFPQPQPQPQRPQPLILALVHPPPPPIQELAESGRAAELQPLAPALYQLCVQIPVEASLA